MCYYKVIKQAFNAWITFRLKSSPKTCSLMIFSGILISLTLSKKYILCGYLHCSLFMFYCCCIPRCARLVFWADETNVQTIHRQETLVILLCLYYMGVYSTAIAYTSYWRRAAYRCMVYWNCNGSIRTCLINNTWFLFFRCNVKKKMASLSVSKFTQPPVRHTLKTETVKRIVNSTVTLKCWFKHNRCATLPLCLWKTHRHSK